VSRCFVQTLVAGAVVGASPGCLALDPDLEPVEVVEVIPAAVEARGPIELVLSAPVRWVEPGGGVDVWVGADEPVAHTLRVGESGRSLVIEPDPRWPDAPQLGLRLREGLMDESGARRAVDTSTRSVLLIEAHAPPPTPRVARLAPTSEHAAPSNLRWIGLIVEPPGPIEGAALRLRDEVWPLEVRANEGGRVRMALAERDRPPPSGEWALALPDGFEVAEGIAGQVDLASAPDPTAPTLETWSVRVEAEAIAIHLEADEPFFVRGAVSTAGRDEVPARAPPFALRSATVRADVLAPETRHRIELELVDVAGNVTTLRPLEVRSAPRLDIAITEIVTTPLHDWGDSDEAGRPFDPLPGDGSVTDTDEWVELVNRSDRRLDLTQVDLRLETMDGTPSVTALSDPPGAYFGAGGDFDRWLPGEALVVRPRGSMSSSDLVVRVVSGDLVLDDVRLADDAGEHAGGAPPDSVRESIARSIWGRWSWCRPTPGDPAAATDCAP
jgi:hypothetical protein